MASIAYPMTTAQASMPDAQASAVMGIALSNARFQIADSIERAFAAGTQFNLARDVALTVIGKAAEIHPEMTVTQLYNLLTTGRR